MKILAMSDLHGQFPNINNIKDIDCVFICGDIVPLDIQRKINKSDEWFKNIFIPWCQAIDCKQIYLIAGNHDFFMAERDRIINQYLLETKIIYLNNQNAEYFDEKTGKTWHIFGSPDCNIFGNWAFMYSPNKELEDFRKMSNLCDIMLTHDAAYGENDICEQNVSWNKHEHIGNPEMLFVLDDRRATNCAPKYHFTGHLHTTSHKLTDYEGIKTACVSLLNEHYKLVYEPLILNI